jgi:anti-sigma B factor antagonist
MESLEPDTAHGSARGQAGRAPGGAITSAQPFGVEARRRDGVLFIRMRGEFDVAAKRAFAAVVNDGIYRQVGEVIVDLRDLTFIDSTGLGLILEIWSKCRRDRIAFAVVPGGEQVTGAFSVAGLTHLLPGQGEP